MSYIEQNLMNGESIVYESKLHWVIFLRPAMCFIVAIIFFSSGSHVEPFGGLFVLIGIVIGIASFINYKTSEFGITNKRVIVKVGFIHRNSIEVLLNKIEGIQVNQGILGRILGFGSITITGTGGTKDPFHKIEAPLEFRRKAQEQIAIVQDLK
ncbi:MAG: PH domain-containing protein [Smithellaceae bacterium]